MRIPDSHKYLGWIILQQQLTVKSCKLNIFPVHSILYICGIPGYSSATLCKTSPNIEFIWSIFLIFKLNTESCQQLSLNLFIQFKHRIYGIEKPCVLARFTGYKSLRSFCFCKITTLFILCDDYAKPSLVFQNSSNSFCL